MERCPYEQFHHDGPCVWCERDSLRDTVVALTRERDEARAERDALRAALVLARPFLLDHGYTGVCSEIDAALRAAGR